MAQSITNDKPLFQLKPSIAVENISILSNDTGNMNINKEFDDNMILEQLNELRQWQESQRRMLTANQLDQQKMLEIEKQKLYELFGLNETASEECNEQDDGDDDTCLQNNEIDRCEKNVGNSFSQTENKKFELQSPSMNQLQKIIENLAVNTPNRLRSQNQNQHPNNENIPKRPYLKRGEGLKNRFKISPDAFRLDKLPKYKYTQRMQKHAQLAQNQDKQRHQLNGKYDKITSNIDADEKEEVEGKISSEGQLQNVTQDSRQSNKKYINNSKSNHRKNRCHTNVTELKLKPIHSENSHQKSNRVSSFQQNVNSVSTIPNQGKLRFHFI